MIVYVHQHSTTITIPAATSTTTSTETVSSNTTIVPDEVTVIKSFSTTSTTTTTLTSVVTDLATTTEHVNATVTETSYAACKSENRLGPLLDNGQVISAVGITDELYPKQDISSTESAYVCCVSCLMSKQHCQYSMWWPARGQCARLLNPAICRGQDYKAGGLSQEDPGTSINTTSQTDLVARYSCSFDVGEERWRGRYFQVV